MDGQSEGSQEKVQQEEKEKLTTNKKKIKY